MGSIRLEKVEKWFGTLQVIKGVDLEIQDGELVIFVGPSGCGKSTLLRLISGLEETSRGRILIDGEDVTAKLPSERGLSMVFQSYALYPHMTVGENMGFGLKTAGESKLSISTKVAEAARILKLENFLERKPKALSGGQRQRVAIGRAITREPRGFLFDEPLSNLDAALRVEMRFEIAKLHETLGTTMVYVTHDQVEAMTLADKIVVLNAGRIEQVGAPLDLYRDPDNIFVAGFIGSPKMNFLSATVRSIADGTATVELEDRGTAPFSVPGSEGLSEGSAVTVGIRPEHFNARGTAHIEAKIDVIEHLGGVSYGYSGAGEDNPLTIALGEEDAAVPGQPYKAGFDPSQAFLFDPKSGLRIR